MENRVIKRFFPYCAVNKEEVWLSEMAEEGWVLCDLSFCRYIFKKKKPQKRQYFIGREFVRSNGLCYDYHAARQRYRANDSDLRKKKAEAEVFEVDIRKIDKDYFTYVRFRNRYYIRHYIKFFVFILFCTAAFLGVYLFSREPVFLFFFFPGFILLIYLIVCILVLKRQSKDREAFIKQLSNGE